MTKSELMLLIAKENPEIYHKNAELIVRTIFAEITDALIRGDSVQLRGFCSFGVKRRRARIGRNPRTTGVVRIPEKHILYFRTGKRMRERLNPHS